MDEVLKVWKTSRQLIGNFFENYSLDQLNSIPNGFSNNLIWNIGHVIVAQQSLIYKGSNLPMHISDRLVERYKTGTRPEGEVSPAEADELKGLLFSLIPPTEADIQKGIFASYTERTTGTGFHLASFRDALEFNNYHEGLHLGYMMGIRKFLR